MGSQVVVQTSPQRVAAGLHHSDIVVHELWCIGVYAARIVAVFRPDGDYCAVEYDGIMVSESARKLFLVGIDYGVEPVPEMGFPVGIAFIMPAIP